MKKFTVALVILLVCSFILVGCGSNTSTTTPVSSSTDSNPAVTSSAVQTGGILKIGYTNRNIISLGYPSTMSGVEDGYQSEACIDTLFRYDEQMQIAPRLATDWKADATAKTITLTLEKGVKFHDGSDFNASVAKWNLDQFRNSKRTELKKIVSIDVLDDATLRLNLSDFDNTIISNLTGDAGRMISQKSFEAHDQAWCEKNPVGTGPFKFSNWEKDVAIKYTRFDDYWGGKPYLDGVQLCFYADSQTVAMAFQNGDVHIAQVTGKVANQLKADSQSVVHALPIGQQPFLAGDSMHASSPFSKIEVRQAMSYAIDSAAICESLGSGYWTPIQQWAVPGTASYNNDLVGYPYNPDKAKELLAKAGYQNGFDTKLYNLVAPDGEEMWGAVQGYLQKVGINATLEVQQRAKYDLTATGGGWENGICACLTAGKPDITISMSPILMKGSLKFPSMQRPDGLEDLFAKVSSATSLDEKNSLIRQVNKLAIDDNCMATFVWMRCDVWVKQAKVNNDSFGTAPGWYISSQIWINK